MKSDDAPISLCVLTYGDYFRLAERCLQSIRHYIPRHQYRLIVGGNALGPETEAFLRHGHEEGFIDHLEIEPENILKCPMMRRLLNHVETELMWWFDDDSYVVDSNAHQFWMQAVRDSDPKTVQWGVEAWCDDPEFLSGSNERELLRFVRTASWYRGLPPPSWRPGGLGEFNYRNQNSGNGRWRFITGGSWLIRTEILRALDWPDPRLGIRVDDLMLGEALRQNHWQFQHLPKPGVRINTARSRGERGEVLSACPSRPSHDNERVNHFS